jgi:hypothetical protein
MGGPLRLVLRLRAPFLPPAGGPLAWADSLAQAVDE